MNKDETSEAYRGLEWFFLAKKTQEAVVSFPLIHSIPPLILTGLVFSTKKWDEILTLHFTLKLQAFEELVALLSTVTSYDCRWYRPLLSFISIPISR